jgi:hypothetical protein
MLAVVAGQVCASASEADSKWGAGNDHVFSFKRLALQRGEIYKA